MRLNVFRKLRLFNKKEIPPMSFMESLNLTELPIVTFENNGKKLNFLLDTGSNNSIINSSVLNELDYTAMEGDSIAVYGVGNASSASCCKMNITYKNTTFTNYFLVMDMDTSFTHIKQTTGVQIHGLLGNKFFQYYKYVIDFNSLIAYSKYDISRK